jgi:hypothetical protein
MVQVEERADQRTGRDLDHERPGTKIEQHRPIRRVRVERESDLFRPSIEHPKTRLLTTPIASLPLKIASADTVGKKNRYACIARLRSASSYARVTVSAVGNPPSNTYESLVVWVTAGLLHSSATAWHAKASGHGSSDRHP